MASRSLFGHVHGAPCSEDLNNTPTSRRSGYDSDSNYPSSFFQAARGQRGSLFQTISILPWTDLDMDMGTF